jgi:hypothetical protein
MDFGYIDHQLLKLVIMLERGYKLISSKDLIEMLAGGIRDLSQMYTYILNKDFIQVA